MNHQRFFQAAVAVFSMYAVFASAQQATSGAGVLLANNAAIITQVPHIALEDLLAYGGEDALLMAWRAKEMNKSAVKPVLVAAKAPHWVSTLGIGVDAAVLLEGDAAIISQVPSLTIEEILEFGGEDPMLLALKGKMVMAR